MHRIYTIMFWFSALLVLTSMVLLGLYGLNLGVDFVGGSVLEVRFEGDRPQADQIKDLLGNEQDFVINEVGDSDIVIKTGEMNEDKHQEILAKLRGGFYDLKPQEKKFDSVGPIIGNELKNKSIVAVVVVLLTVIIYIAFVFRKLSRTLSPWTMGAAAIVALLHDILIPLGVFAVLGKFFDVEISAVFVAAALTILGYSISDTVVVFDRVRENVIRMNESFSVIVHRSILQTLTRSLNTTFTTLLALFAIYFFGGESIRYFSLAMIIGIFSGAYSSIFVASPILAWWSRG